MNQKPKKTLVDDTSSNTGTKSVVENPSTILLSGPSVPEPIIQISTEIQNISTL